MAQVLKTNQLNPDGVMIEVDMSKLYAGSSFFIPCLNIPLATKQVQDIAAQHGMRPFTIQTSIHEGMLGIRVWE